MSKLIFGCGYLGRRVARLWLASGETVYAVTRSAERAQQLAVDGLRPLVADFASLAQIEAPQDVETVLFAIGFDRSGTSTIHDVYCRGLVSASDWMRKSVNRFLYISSTGVYGQASGEEVDENSPCEPTREGGKACRAAERALMEGRFGQQSIILRLAGLYGPGRVPRAADLAAGRPIDAPAEGWLNLIHVDDAAALVLMAEERAQPPRTYVVADGHPVQRHEYYAELARLVGTPAPRFVAPAAECHAAGRAAGDKRVNPRRLFAELKPRLRYPDYRAGLAAIVETDAAQEELRSKDLNLD